MSSENDKLFDKLTKFMQEANEKQTSDIKNEIKAEILTIKEEIKSEIITLKNGIKEETQKRKEIEERQIKLEYKYSSLEKTIKKNNIIIFGLAPENENLANYTIAKINELLEVQINIGLINNIFSIGTAANSPRPIIVQFVSYLTKLDILKQCKKLKGTGISISEQFSKEEREARKVLIRHRQKARSKNLNAFIKNNKLVINGDTYTVEELQRIENDKEEEEEIYTEQVRESEIIETEDPRINRCISSAPATPNQVEENKQKVNDEGNEQDLGRISDDIDSKVTKKRKVTRAVRHNYKIKTYISSNEKKKSPKKNIEKVSKTTTIASTSAS